MVLKSALAGSLPWRKFFNNNKIFAINTNSTHLHPRAALQPYGFSFPRHQHANTYKYRMNLTRTLAHMLTFEPATDIAYSRKPEKFMRKAETSKFQFSTQKTLYLYKKGHSVKEIAEARELKESTVWEHLAKLIQHNQLQLRKVLPEDKIYKIKSKIHSPEDKLKEIKKRINDSSITYDEINCVLAAIKHQSKRKHNSESGEKFAQQIVVERVKSKIPAKGTLLPCDK